MSKCMFYLHLRMNSNPAWHLGRVDNAARYLDHKTRSVRLLCMAQHQRTSENLNMVWISPLDLTSQVCVRRWKFRSGSFLTPLVFLSGYVEMMSELCNLPTHRHRENMWGLARHAKALTEPRIILQLCTMPRWASQFKVTSATGLFLIVDWLIIVKHAVLFNA